jgi:hypothetical protein
MAKNENLGVFRTDTIYRSLEDPEEAWRMIIINENNLNYQNSLFP